MSVRIRFCRQASFLLGAALPASVFFCANLKRYKPDMYFYAERGDSMALEGTRIGRYQMMQLIGCGGMGEVYLAQDTRIARQVAIKVVRTGEIAGSHTGDMHDTHRLFEREMQAILLLDHPNILPLYDFGEEHTSHGVLTYMVMPFRPEGSLSRWLENSHQDGLLAPHELLCLLQQAASALQHAHTVRIMHLDVKLSNFLVRLREQASACPDLLLADFGISRFSTATATASQSIRGTPLSMAPEQCTGFPVLASDQYALAIMAYQLLTGSPPFKGNMQQVMYQHLHVVPKPPGTLNPMIPSAVDDVLLQALAKRPEERFASIALFVDMLASAWQQIPSFPGSLEDPEERVPTTRMHPYTKAPYSPVHPSSTPDPALPVAEHHPARVVQSPAFAPLRKRVPYAPHSIIPAPRRTPHIVVLSLVVTVCIVLASLSLGVRAFLSTRSAPVSIPDAVLPTPLHTPERRDAPTPEPEPTAASQYPQLKPFYSGTATGYAHATITFSLQGEDQQGNVMLQTTFERTDNQASAIYTCQGQVGLDNQITLYCVETGIPNFHLNIHGIIFPDGHMEGTEEATETNNPAYDHLYTWSAF